MGKSMGAFVTKWKRTSGREENFYFTIDQMRSKFKKCVSECKKGALTIKSGTGIKRFQEDIYAMENGFVLQKWKLTVTLDTSL